MEKNTVVINKKISTITKALEVNGDIIVPDIKPDIVNIINTNGIPYIYKEDISNGRLRLDGNIDTYVVYLADTGETRSIQTILSFSEIVEEKGITEKSIVKEKIILEGIETKILNERKITIKANLKIKLEFYEKDAIEITTSLDEMEGVEILKETVDIKSIVGTNKIKTTVKEDILVDENHEIAEILKTDLEISNLENKISYNKVLAKADANVKIVYLCENGRIETQNASIPIMSFIDIDKVAEGHICNTEYFVRNMLFKMNSKEAHSINCQIEFEVCCDAYEVKTIDVIQDMYGTKNNIEFTKRDVLVQTNAKEVNEKININERISIEDILNIYDTSLNTRVLNKTKSGNYYNYECELQAQVFYEADSRNGINVKDISLPFVHKSTEEEIEFIINRKQFTVSNENVNCEVEILARKNDNCLKNISVIDEVNVSELEEEDYYKMFVYFVKSGDTIWKIAKHFKVCPSDIISVNNLENPDKLEIGDRLYIAR